MDNNILRAVQFGCDIITVLAIHGGEGYWKMKSFKN
jgi:hypothetical protein